MTVHLKQMSSILCLLIFFILLEKKCITKQVYMSEPVLRTTAVALRFFKNK